MKHFFLALGLFVSVIGIGQCPIGNVTLSNQAEVNAFALNYPNCTEIDGSLEISGSISDLTPLSNIEQINGFVTISSNNLVNLQGLNNLLVVQGNFLLAQCSALTSINGLESLEQTGAVLIGGNQNLQNLNGFQSLHSIGSLDIVNNQSLSNISGLSSLNNVYHIKIDQCPSLQNLTGLEGVTTLTGELSIANSGIQNLNGINNLTCASSIELVYNSNLNDITALNSCTNVHDIEIDHCPSLTALSGLEGISNVSGTLFVGHSGVQSMVGLNNLQSVGSLRLIVNIDLWSLSGLENLFIATNLEISKCANLFSIDALDNLAYVNGELKIINNLLLTDMSGLDHEINIGSLELVGNTNLAACAVQSVCDHLITNSANISNNGYNCNTEAEVEAQCGMNLTQLKTAHCGEQLTTFIEIFYADAVPGATHYMIRFKDISNNNVTEVEWNSSGFHLYGAGLLDIDKTYKVRVKAKVNGFWGVYGPECLLHSPNQVPTTQLKPAHCDEQLSAFNEVFYCYHVTGATQYEWKFTDQSGQETYSLWNTTGHHLHIPGLYAFGETYSVQIRANVNGNWSDFGPACDIHSPQTVPNTQLTANHCGEQLTTFNEVFYTQTVTGATQYEFKFTHSITGVETTNVWNTSGHHLHLVNLYEIGATYYVQTRAYVNNTWGNWGDTCLIHAPQSVPQTYLISSDCGITLGSYGEPFYCQSVAGAELYRFRFWDGTNETLSDRFTNSNSLNIAGLLVQGVTYEVEVMARINGIWGNYNTVCTLTAPPNPPANLPGQGGTTYQNSNQTDEQTTGSDEWNPAVFSIYPNPANKELYVNTTEENYSIIIYSINGQLVYQHSFETSNTILDIGHLENGMYLLQIYNAENELLEIEKISIVH